MVEFGNFDYWQQQRQSVEEECCLLFHLLGELDVEDLVLLAPQQHYFLHANTVRIRFASLLVCEYAIQMGFLSFCIKTQVAVFRLCQAQLTRRLSYQGFDHWALKSSRPWINIGSWSDTNGPGQRSSLDSMYLHSAGHFHQSANLALRCQLCDAELLYISIMHLIYYFSKLVNKSSSCGLQGWFDFV